MVGVIIFVVAVVVGVGLPIILDITQEYKFRKGKLKQHEIDNYWFYKNGFGHPT